MSCFARRYFSLYDVKTEESIDEKVKRFKLDDSKGVKLNTELVPPPVTSRLSVPFNYS